MGHGEGGCPDSERKGPFTCARVTPRLGDANRAVGGLGVEDRGSEGITEKVQSKLK